ncbi:AbrB family transcriptional regulator [Anaerosphaera multitolerans]|uniref:Membrane-spanning protein n=1 Tax=Anaerosphaera multitolerans TaxID=2487351 RepID=A0A437S635_9FIRM|nr:AbrB family transcriptional regulator [Anaerosphaera multitolerans]RVU54512.1 membrane-spanning protein [Anaerosphaera multitolerans]
MDFLITFGIALVLGIILYKLKVPGGMMVGAILGAAAFNIFTGRADMPDVSKFIAQVIAGAFIGSGMSKNDLNRLPKLFKPILILLFNLLVLNIVMGIVIWKISSLDIITSLMSVVPGGMSDIPLIAEDMGANAGVVATLQFVRMTVGIGIFPTFIQKFDMRFSSDNPNKPFEKETRENIKVKKREYNWIHLGLTLFVAFLGGYIGKRLGVPAGTLSFSMFAVLILKLTTGIGNLTIEMKRFAQLLSGTYIGSGIGLKDVLMLKELLIPVILIVVGYMANCIWTGAILNKVFKIERKEAMLAATPAGASDMALISSDIGVVSVDLIVMQIIRMIFVIAVFPQVITLVVNLF